MMRRWLAALLLATLPDMAVADAVFVDAGFGEVGNGWLFGSHRDEACWVALPWHVVATMETEETAPFIFTDPSGQVGETAPPIRVSRSAKALATTNGNSDLAFARVTAGISTKGCTGRLGLPGVGFAEALQASPRLTFTAMQETTRIAFPAEPFRLSADAGRGSTFLVRPANPADAAYLQGGLSGGTVTMEWQGRPQPAGMVLSVLEDQSAAVVLRFDRLRAAFEIIEAEQAGTVPPPISDSGQAAAVVVQGLRGSIGQGSTPLTGILAEGGCWRAGPPAGARAVEIVLSVSGLAADAAHGIRLVADAACGGPESFVIDRQEADGAWVTVTTACHSGPPGGPACRLPAKPDLVLRLRASPRQGWLGLSRIVFD